MINKGGDGGWKNTGQLGVHNESDGLRYNISYSVTYSNLFSGNLSGQATYTQYVHLLIFLHNGQDYNSEEAHTHKLVMIDKGGGWRMERLMLNWVFIMIQMVFVIIF